MFQGCLMKVSWERKFHGCFKGVSRVFQRSFKKTIKLFQKKVSSRMELIAASRAEGGLVSIISQIQKCLNCHVGGGQP